jgi:predicted MFS family arabinose efflux permease
MAAGLRYIWTTPSLRTTLLCSAGINVPFAGLSLAVIAAHRDAGAAHLGVVFGMGSVGGLLGAWGSTAVLHRFTPVTVILGFGWFAAAALGVLGIVPGGYATGAVIALLWAAAAPANGVLYAAIIAGTPAPVQGRVISAAITVMGVSAPLGPLLGGALVERYGPVAAFAAFGAIVAVSTAALYGRRRVFDEPRGVAATRDRRTSASRPRDAPPTAASTPRPR